MEIKRKKKLSSVFISCMAVFMAQTGILALAAFVIFGILINTGFILPANYTIDKLEEASEVIKEAEYVEAHMLPEETRYGVYDAEGNYLYGSFTEEEQKAAVDGRENVGGQLIDNSAYRFIERYNGEVCAVRYQILAQFSNAYLREHLPNVERLFMGIAFVLFVTGIFCTARMFSKYMSRRFDTLNEVTGRIRREDLEFGRAYSDIREIDEVLESLFKMKEELKTSLKKQWASEEEKTVQIAALAHDIKTPLTVIRGNVELIQETPGEAHIKEYNTYVLNSVQEIEKYLMILQETLHSVNAQNIELQEVDGLTFLEWVFQEAKSIGREKRINISTEFRDVKGTLWADEEKLRRAFMNILSNAVEYSPFGGVIYIDKKPLYREGKEYIEVKVTDCGPGFTEEALRHGTEQFFQGDKSRHEKGHYGMGLYIASRFVEEHEGEMKIGNSEHTGGGQITVILPIDFRRT